MNAFELPSRPSVMNCREVRQAHARSQIYRSKSDYLKPRPSQIHIDPNPQASADRRQAILRGSI